MDFAYINNNLEYIVESFIKNKLIRRFLLVKQKPLIQNIYSFYHYLKVNSKHYSLFLFTKIIVR
jgi:hypothetical protein